MFLRKFLTAAFAVVLTVGLGVGGALAEEPPKRTYRADKGPDTVDVSKFSLEVQNNYQLFTTRCGKCHTRARAINTNKTTIGWRMYVDRMVGKPASGISKADSLKIYQFLKFYQEHKNKQKKK